MTEPADQIRPLEQALVNGDATGLAEELEGALDALIADDFFEFGASGREWDAPTTKGLLAAAPSSPRATVELDRFEAFELAPDVVLVTYRLGPPRPANRSSIWVRRRGRWQIRFHQGTLRPPGGSR
jgi:hypothetical protein